MTTQRLEAHRAVLLAQRRCPACAEHRPARALLRGEACPHCEASGLVSHLSLERRIELALGSLRRKRLVGYFLTAAAAAVGGIVPLVATLTTVLAMLLMRRALFHDATAWLSPSRRVATKPFLRQWLVLSTLIMLVADQAATLLPVPGWPLRVLSAVGTVALYVEVSLRIVENRLRRDQSSPQLQAGEWLLPLLTTLGMLLTAVAAAAMVAAAYAAVQWIFDGVQGWIGGLA